MRFDATKKHDDDARQKQNICSDVKFVCKKKKKQKQKQKKT
jgi:hypothetical protein